MVSNSSSTIIIMKLFEQLETGFFTDKEETRKNNQKYYNLLADVVKKGKAYLKDEITEDVVYRDLTEQEKEEIFYQIGLWLSKLN